MNEIVTLQSDRLKVEIWTLGARLNGVWFDGIGSLVDGAATEEEARGNKKYNGAVVGPVANRIADGRAHYFDLEHGDTQLEFEKNENGSTTLHSGSTGTHAQVWDIVEQTENTLTLRLELPDGTGGFPGNRTLMAEYSVHGHAFGAVFQASSDKPTWINLALHPYWRLATAGRDGSRLSVSAYGYLPVDETKIPTGRVEPVTGTKFDLSELTEPSTEIDHNYCLYPQPLNEPRMRLEGDLGIAMDVVTNAPGVQIYTGKAIGIAIEPQLWPDAMHHANFPSILHRPGDFQSSSYLFSRI
ncbi:MAG: galactose mutarotase [Pseudomonadota bacterium]